MTKTAKRELIASAARSLKLETRERFLSNGNAYTMSLRGRKLDAIMLATSQMSEQDRQLARIRITDEVLEKFSKCAGKAVKLQGNWSVLELGCLTHLFFVATEGTSRRGKRKAFFRDVGQSSSQCYRSRDVFLRLGPAFLAEPHLLEAFSSVEALKVSATGLEAARTEILDMARAGKEINTETAWEVVRKHKLLNGDIPAITGDSEARKSRVPLVFNGATVRITISCKPKLGFPSNEVLIDEMRAAISRLLEESTSNASGETHRVK